MSRRIHMIKCNNCNHLVASKHDNVLTYCRCGQIAVDQNHTEGRYRVIGSGWSAKSVIVIDPENETVDTGFSLPVRSIDPYPFYTNMKRAEDLLSKRSTELYTTAIDMINSSGGFDHMTKLRFDIKGIVFELIRRSKTENTTSLAHYIVEKFREKCRVSLNEYKLNDLELKVYMGEVLSKLRFFSTSRAGEFLWNRDEDFVMDFISGTVVRAEACFTFMRGETLVIELDDLFPYILAQYMTGRVESTTLDRDVFDFVMKGSTTFEFDMRSPSDVRDAIYLADTIQSIHTIELTPKKTRLVNILSLTWDNRFDSFIGFVNAHGLNIRTKEQAVKLMSVMCKYEELFPTQINNDHGSPFYTTGEFEFPHNEVRMERMISNTTTWMENFKALMEEI